MPRSVQMYFEDIQRATAYILRATQGFSQQTFFEHPDIPFAVERNFMIIGEALAQMRQHYPAVFAQVPDAPLIVAFRNILIHAYASTDPQAVWSAIQSDVAPLQSAVRRLQEQYPG